MMIFLKIWLKYNHNTLRAHITYNGLLAASVKKITARLQRRLWESMAYIVPYITSWGHLLLCTWSYCDLDFGSLSKAYQEIQEFTGYNACTVPEINWVLVGFRWFETPQCCDKFFIEVNNKIKYIFFKNFFPKIAI